MAPLARLRAGLTVPCVLAAWATAAVADPPLAAAQVPSAPAAVVHEVGAVPYADVRQALEDAIAAEGLTAPAVSRFGEMLARTAADLGHRGDIYGEAEIFSFCSVRVAARLVEEDPLHITLCPLTVALYTLRRETGRVFLAYRPPAVESPGGRLARETLARIAARTLDDADPATRRRATR